MKERIIKELKLMTRDYMPSNGKHYYIFKATVDNRTRYGIIDHEVVDSNGKLTKPLNGIEMMLSDTIAELIDRVEKQIKVDKLVAKGIDIEVAAIAVTTGMSVKKVQALWNQQ